MKPSLIRLTSTWGSHQEPCWVDPGTVTGIVASGLPGCTRLDRGSQPCILVLGTPEAVFKALYPTAEDIEA
jgi:hypothetical protein